MKILEENMQILNDGERFVQQKTEYILEKIHTSET